MVIFSFLALSNLDPAPSPSMRKSTDLFIDELTSPPKSLTILLNVSLELLDLPVKQIVFPFSGPDLSF